MQNLTMFRIYTEHKNEPETTRTIGLFFEGFTRYENLGYWKETKENSLMFEVITKNTAEAREKLNTIAETLKRHNQQESVLITRQPIKTAFI